MSERQQHLSEYCAGLFDGDGHITPGVSTSDYTNIGYRLNPECTLTNRYVAGLYDAEGCVKPQVAKKPNSAVNHHIDANARIANSDDALVSKLCEYADAIGVDYNVHHHKPDTENHDPTFQFDVRTIGGVRTFLNSLRPHLVVKREQAEIMVDEILPLLEEGVHGTRRGFIRVMHHIDRMNGLKGGKRGKYNVEYFEDLWGMEYDPTRYE